MTDLTQYRLSLLLALFGALTVLAHTWTGFVSAHSSHDLPLFERSAPDVREWPIHHQYLPIG